MRKLNNGDQWEWFEVVILGAMDWEDLTKMIFQYKHREDKGSSVERFLGKEQIQES